MVLGDHGIKEQGTWQEIKEKAASIAKFNHDPQTKSDVVLTANFDKLKAQVRAKDEAEVDLSRQTGDLALYGTVPAQTMNPTSLNSGYYFGFVGLINLLLLASCTASYSFFITIPQYWLQLWTESNGRNSVFYICGFLLLSTMSWTSTSVMMW